MSTPDRFWDELLEFLLNQPQRRPSALARLRAILDAASDTPVPVVKAPCSGAATLDPMTTATLAKRLGKSPRDARPIRRRGAVWFVSCVRQWAFSSATRRCASASSPTDNHTSCPTGIAAMSRRDTGVSPRCLPRGASS